MVHGQPSTHNPCQDLRGQVVPARCSRGCREGAGGMSTVASTRAHQLYERAQQVIPGGVTSSFRAAVKPEPIFADHAQGAEIFDADGLRHLDFALAWGPLIPRAGRRVTKTEGIRRSAGGWKRAGVVARRAKALVASARGAG